ncbi:DUF72 domain-containing protein [Hymenobacter chitinivorans]|uniref:Uncharacterized protein YecE (DUF72 family) n=1 Tax=Hymenobacter chitinivorans DSM 11115 TaxID=1121954 RepID=A0A2M9BKZ3_9BACT|nr:DUF72 domain-containing protein [Hymenobacter chitinivorans]PJJ58627.1 uncharacterized protein YecE (DUF72 family) [Hymenobacter chitinivorans DSM 11115]
MTTWFIGCSGFHYRHWRGTFYPEKLPQRRWFEFYAQYFNTLELNVTFYRFPQLAFVENWYQISPPEFVFATKAPRLITHYKQFHDCAQLLADFYGTMQEGLREKLGPVLFQLPPRTVYTEERLLRLVESLDPAFTNVVEFRHPSWWHERVFQELSRRNVTFVGQSHPALPTDVIANTSTLYYRLHGIPELYKSPYSEAELHQLAHQIQQEPGVERAFVYFNNDIDASAIRNGQQLRDYCRHLGTP